MGKKADDRVISWHSDWIDQERLPYMVAVIISRKSDSTEQRYYIPIYTYSDDITKQLAITKTGLEEPVYNTNMNGINNLF